MPTPPLVSPRNQGGFRGRAVTIRTVSLLSTEMDDAWETLRRRLDGLTDEEFFWEPVPDCRHR